MQFTNQYDTWLVKILRVIRNIKELMVKLLRKYKHSHRVETHIVSCAKGVKNAESTPKGHFRVNVSPVKVVLSDDIEATLLNTILGTGVFAKNNNPLDLTDGWFLIEKKSAAARFIEDDVSLGYQSTYKVNKVIKEHTLIKNAFYLEDYSYKDYKLQPDSKKLKID